MRPAGTMTWNASSRGTGRPYQAAAVVPNMAADGGSAKAQARASSSRSAVISDET
jgi:hypothetical protein